MLFSLRPVARRVLSHLPFKVGQSYIIPTLKRRLIIEEERREVRRILRAARRPEPVRSASVVYDNIVSSPTYGDFLEVVMLARALGALSLRPDFYIVRSQYRHDWAEHLPGGERLDTAASARVDEQIRVARSLLAPFDANVSAHDWGALTQRGGLLASGRALPFDERVRLRRSIYDAAFNVLNRLVATMTPDQRSRCLLCAGDLARYVHWRRPEGPYVAWNCRHSLRDCFDRNTDESEFERVHGVLSARFPGRRILVVSDSVGCAHFRQVARRRQVDCLFSADYGGDFLADAGLALESDFYFQAHGSGMAIVAICSTVPYAIKTTVRTHHPWTPDRFTSWQTDQQSLEIVDPPSPEAKTSRARITWI